MTASYLVRLLRGVVAAGALFAAAATQSVSGQDFQDYTPGSSLGDLEARISALEQGDSGDSYTATLATDGYPGLIAFGDFLYWTVRNPGFEYGITATAPQVQDGGPVGRVESIGSDYAPAFRVGLGWRFGDACNGPEVLMTYTRFVNQTTEVGGPGRATIISSDNAVNTDGDMDTDLSILAPLPGLPHNVTPEDIYTSAIATYRFDYNAWDAVIAQNLMMTDTLTFRLSGGGRYMRMREVKQVTYNGLGPGVAFPPLNPSLDFEIPYTAAHTGAFDGGGIIVGGETRWRALRNFTLNFGLNTGMLIGSSRTHTVLPDSPDPLSLLPPHVLTTPTDVYARETRIVPVLELTAAIDYRMDLGFVTLNASAGYQFTNYFNLSDTRTFSDAFQEGQNTNVLNAITLDGFFIRGGMNY